MDMRHDTETLTWQFYKISMIPYAKHVEFIVLLGLHIKLCQIYLIHMQLEKGCKILTEIRKNIEHCYYEQIHHLGFVRKIQDVMPKCPRMLVKER